MTTSYYQLYERYLTQNVLEPFYEKRFRGLRSLTLEDVLRRKNPSLFKAKNFELAGELVKSILDAFLSSAEETYFGNLLEGFAIFVSSTVDDGFKSQLPSIDLEFQRDGKYYIVGIKSGPNWGNSDQINIMRNNFRDAKVKLREIGYQDVVAVNGCMYGKDNGFKIDKSKEPDRYYYKYCGQVFWQFISGDDQLYQRIVVPIDKEAKTKDEAFKAAYVAKANEMTGEFINKFMSAGQINWVRLIDHVSKVPSGA